MTLFDKFELFLNDNADFYEEMLILADPNEEIDWPEDSQQLKHNDLLILWNAFQHSDEMQARLELWWPEYDSRPIERDCLEEFKAQRDR